MIYASAFYAFYSLITATVYAVRARKLHRPAFSAAKALNLDGALMSILALQTAMLAQFGEGDAAFRQVMNLATGAAVTLLSAALAVFLIVYAARTGRTNRQTRARADFRRKSVAEPQKHGPYKARLSKNSLGKSQIKDLHQAGFPFL